MDPLPESEVLCEGWMVKSPPLEAKPIPGYSLFKAVRNDNVNFYSAKISLKAVVFYLIFDLDFFFSSDMNV